MIFLNFILSLVLAPILPGLVNRVKAFFAGRRGQPVLQLYFDLGKLLRKNAVYSRTTTWVFKAGPIVSLASFILILFFLPAWGIKSPAAFSGDFLLVIYLLALARFFMVLAALDTGSSFEGMGASREVQFALFAEPVLFLGLAALAKSTGSFSLSGMYERLSWQSWLVFGPVLALVAVAFFVVFLAENCRLPVDDPNTHLELTMIHEVMILDHSGPDLAVILYASALKFWMLAALVVGVVLPVRGGTWPCAAAFLGGMFLVALVTGILESVLARLRLLKVPQMLIEAGAFAVLALILSLR